MLVLIFLFKLRIILSVIDKNALLDNSISRPNSDIDLLATSYLANLRFLGHNPPSLLSSSLLSGSKSHNTESEKKKNRVDNPFFSLSRSCALRSLHRVSENFRFGW